MFSRRYALCFLVAIAAFVAACSNTSKSPAPTAPTTTTQSTSAGTPIDLTTVTPPGTQGAGSEKPVVGTVGQLTGTCPDLTFVLSGVTIHTSSRTVFEGGSCSDVKEGVRAGAIGTKRTDGSIDAARVKIAPPPPPPPERVGGVVSALSGTCPALTFTLSGTTIHTTDKTVFEGGACGDVKEGMRAAAVGHKAADGSITAVHVKIVVPPPPPVTGTIGSLSGTCPAVTFVLSGTTIHTNDKTQFEGGSCADLKEGMRAGAVGPKAADGSITAERVKIAPPPPPAVAGTISALAGTCPNVTFVLSGTTVRTSDKTRFEGGACGDLKNDIRAAAIGPKAADGAIEAQVVKIAPPK